MQSGEKKSVFLAPGQFVGHGRYQLTRMLNKGGMSHLWLARDSRTREEVALKFLPAEILNDAAAFGEMRKESAKTLKFSHPNIIRIFDVHESDDEAPFISMEFVEGDNLHNLSGLEPRGIFTWQKLKPWVEQLCDALTYAHGQGVIHRDIKPANMMIDANGCLKLADFGISMTVDESKQRGHGSPITGTLGYMSPQQLSGHPAHVTDDIHALGATLYELLSGRRPFGTGDVYTQMLQAKAKPLNEVLWEQGLTNDIPPDVSSLVMACLAKDPAMRPASAKVIKEWLGLKTITTVGTRYFISGRAIRTNSAGNDPEEPLSSTTRDRGRSLLYKLLLLFLLASLIYFLHRYASESWR